MAKKVLGGLSVLVVCLTVFTFFVSPTKIGVGAKKQPVEKTKKTTDITKNKKNPALTDLPTVSPDDWELLLVNWEHPLAEEVTNLVEMKNGYLIDERVYPFYYSMEEDAKAAGFELTVISAYRSIESQREVFDQGMAEHLAEGLTEAEAQAKTKEFITEPGTSEHHTGLALDVVDQTWYDAGNGLEQEFGETAAGKWLADYCANYGFVIRYLPGREGDTNINYEPWHLRYVGEASAQHMKKHDLVLEEYLDLLREAGQ